MSKYAISYIDWFSHELKMQKLVAFSEKQALIYALQENSIDVSDIEEFTIEEIKQFAFDCDCMVGALCIDD